MGGQFIDSKKVKGGRRESETEVGREKPNSAHTLAGLAFAKYLRALVDFDFSHAQRQQNRQPLSQW